MESIRVGEDLGKEPTSEEGPVKREATITASHGLRAEDADHDACPVGQDAGERSLPGVRLQQPGHPDRAELPATSGACSNMQKVHAIERELYGEIVQIKRAFGASHQVHSEPDNQGSLLRVSEQLRSEAVREIP